MIDRDRRRVPERALNLALAVSLVSAVTVGWLASTVNELNQRIDALEEYVAGLKLEPMPSASPSPTPFLEVAPDPLSRIDTLKEIQKESLKRGTFVTIMPEAVLDNDGKVKEIKGTEIDAKGNESQKTYGLAFSFPPTPTESLFYFPSIVEGKVKNIHPYVIQNSFIVFDIEMGNQVWNFMLKNNGGSYLAVKEGDEIKLGEPLMAINRKGYLESDPTYGTQRYTSDDLIISAHPKDLPEGNNYLDEAGILKNSYDGKYITVPTVEHAGPTKSA